MHNYIVYLENNHIFIELDRKKWLIDTGAPSSFGEVHTIELAGKDFSVPEDYMGLSASKLTEYIGVEYQGLIGVDILNNFDLAIDLGNNRLGISSEEINIDGENIPMDDFMDILTAYSGI